MINNKKTKMEVILKTEELCQKIKSETINCWSSLYNQNNLNVYSSIGKKYIKVLIEENSNRRVWGFINLENINFTRGDILFASSYNKPALNKSRGNLFEGYEINQNRINGPDYLK